MLLLLAQVIGLVDCSKTDRFGWVNEVPDVAWQHIRCVTCSCFCYEGLICYCIYSKVVCVDLTVFCVYILFDVDTAGKYFDQMSITLLLKNVLW